MDVLLERERVLARLTALLEESSTGAGRLVFLAGEAGVGKTALVAALAAAAPAGVRVRTAGSDSITTPAALGPFLEAVPELSEAVEDARGIDRLLLFRRLRAVLAPEPTLLVLEDVHWADGATLDMLRFLGRRLGELPLLVVATYRDDETAASSPLTGFSVSWPPRRTCSARPCHPSRSPRCASWCRSQRQASPPRSCTPSPAAIRSSSPRCSARLGDRCR